MKTRKLLALILSTTMAVTLLAACSAPAGKASTTEVTTPSSVAENPSAKEGSASGYELKIRSGSTSGSWYPATGAMAKFLPADIPGLKVTVTPGSGPANVQAIQDGICDFAFGKMPSTMQGMRGEEPFKAPTDQVTYLGYLYDESFHLVVPANSGINSVEDLKGKVLTTQTNGNLAEQMMRELLSAYDMSYDDLKRVNQVGYDDSVQQMKDGVADAFAFATAAPASVLMDLCASRDMTLLSIPDEKLDKMLQINNGYMKKTIPADTYKGQAGDVATFGGAVHMMACKSLDEELVYQITKSIYQNIDKLGESHTIYEGLTPEIMAQPTVIPFHPGAERYLKEIGVLK